MIKGLEILISEPALLLHWRNFVALLFLSLLAPLLMDCFRTRKELYIAMAASTVILLGLGFSVTTYMLGETYTSIKALATTKTAIMVVNNRVASVIEPVTSVILGESVNGTKKIGGITWELVPSIAKTLQAEGISKNYSTTLPTKLPKGAFWPAFKLELFNSPFLTLTGIALIIIISSVLLFATGLFSMQSKLPGRSMGTLVALFILTCAIQAFVSIPDQPRNLLGVIQTEMPYTITLTNSTAEFFVADTCGVLGQYITVPRSIAQMSTKAVASITEQLPTNAQNSLKNNIRIARLTP